MYNNDPDIRTPADAYCPAPPDRSPPARCSPPPPAGGHHTGAATHNLLFALLLFFASLVRPARSFFLDTPFPFRQLHHRILHRDQPAPLPAPNSLTPRPSPCPPIPGNCRSAGSPHRNSSTRSAGPPMHSITLSDNGAPARINTIPPPHPLHLPVTREHRHPWADAPSAPGHCQNQRPFPQTRRRSAKGRPHMSAHFPSPSPTNAAPASHCPSK